MCLSLAYDFMQRWEEIPPQIGHKPKACIKRRMYYIHVFLKMSTHAVLSDFNYNAERVMCDGSKTELINSM